MFNGELSLPSPCLFMSPSHPAWARGDKSVTLRSTTATTHPCTPANSHSLFSRLEYMKTTFAFYFALFLFQDFETGYNGTKNPLNWLLFVIIEYTLIDLPSDWRLHDRRPLAICVQQTLMLTVSWALLCFDFSLNIVSRGHMIYVFEVQSDRWVRKQWLIFLS